MDWRQSCGKNDHPSQSPTLYTGSLDFPTNPTPCNYGHHHCGCSWSSLTVLQFQIWPSCGFPIGSALLPQAPSCFKLWDLVHYPGNLMSPFLQVFNNPFISNGLWTIRAIPQVHGGPHLPLLAFVSGSSWGATLGFFSSMPNYHQDGTFLTQPSNTPVFTLPGSPGTIWELFFSLNTIDPPAAASYKSRW